MRRQHLGAISAFRCQSGAIRPCFGTENARWHRDVIGWQVTRSYHPGERPGEPLATQVGWISPGVNLFPDNHSYPEYNPWGAAGQSPPGISPLLARLASGRLGRPDAGVAGLLTPDAIVLPSDCRACSATHEPGRLAG
jgi:hypothetical protein